MQKRLLMRLLLPILLGGSGLSCTREQPAELPVAEQSAPASATADLTGAAEPGEPLPEPEHFEPEEGFLLLTLDDFEPFRAGPDTWRSSGPLIRSTGKPKGYIYTKESYEDFTLRLDYRFLPAPGIDEANQFAGNTGFLIYIGGEHKQWPVSLEVQGKYPEMGTIKANGGADTPQIQDDETARQQARKPPREWNSIEIVSRGGGLTASINGTPVCESHPGSLTEGRIGIQAEDFPFEVRNIRIRSGTAE